ncbi:hypothetical protein JD844_001154 [Phrynosoma platyrhinos]|uniref:G-protein coupled receptors family 3 profile domain-containing protein n=1 Tax=Phrynosoma platyrhinos TaxID=52577 RepID=A0ABQ7T9C4_PHRPL|nr:hypothetical protein JD844_001154 [Phrynosoma platyrhinos]
MMCTMNNPHQLKYQHYQPGDLIIGGITSQLFSFSEGTDFTTHPTPNWKVVPLVMLKNYQHVLSLVFAVKEINENHKILPNITLGFHVYDSHFDAQITYENTLNLLFNQKRAVLNYNCDMQKNPVAVVGGLDSETSFHIATILSLYKIPQYTGIVKLLLHFEWKWVGLMAMHDDKGEKFMQTLQHMFSQNGICIAFTERMPIQSNILDVINFYDLFMEIAMTVMKANVNVCVVSADPHMMLDLQAGLNMLASEIMIPLNKVWLLTAHWDFSVEPFFQYLNIQVFHGALSFAVHSTQVPGFQHFLHVQKPHSDRDGFIRVFWEQAFHCSFPNSDVTEVDGEICTGEEKLDNLLGPFFEMSMTSQSYSIYNAVYAIAHALHAMYSSRTKHAPIGERDYLITSKIQYFQLHPFLASISFNNSAGDTVSFDKKGELIAAFDIINWVTFPNQSFSKVKVGRMDPQSPLDRQLSINENIITWQRQFNQTVPIALCNDPCHPGYSRMKKEGQPFCCYDYTNDCFKCPEEQYPNKGRNECLSKGLNFLSYDEPLGIILAILALSLSVITVFVFGIFIKHRNTAIVKANNQNLTFSLLISLFLCFLCSLFFIGHPDLMTCQLRQTAFGIIFSVVVSSVLAKTITVVLAFMITKPGAKLRKWVGKKLNDTLHVQHEYYQPGDFSIGGMASQLFSPQFTPMLFSESPQTVVIHTAVPKNYQHVLSLVFAVKEINDNPTVLSNITLGFQIYENYFKARMTYQNTLNLISCHKKIIPNYKCDVEKNLIAVIGGLDSEISLHMASILSLYKIPQVTYCLFSLTVSDKAQLTIPYQMFPSEEHQYNGILQLLLHFQWKWIGIIVMADDRGEKFAQTLTHLLFLKGICTAFIARTPAHSDFFNINEMLLNLQYMLMNLSNTDVDIFVVNADTHTALDVQWLFVAAELYGIRPLKKVWVMTAHWDFSSETFQRDMDAQNFHGALSFAIQSNVVQGFQNFLLNLHPPSDIDGFIKDFWEQAFICSFTDMNVDPVTEDICTGEEKLESLPATVFEMSMTSQSYSIYNAVYAVAHALHAMYLSRAKRRARGQCWDIPKVQHFQLHPFLRSIMFNNSAGDKMFFNDNGELEAGFDIINWVTFPNKSFLRVKVGKMDPQAPQDMNDCFKCPEDQYPKKEKNQCLHKALNFLSYGEPLGISLVVLALALSAVATLVLGIFIKHQNTPIVKANNQNLTYILLISLLLCTLCSFLFIGQPQMLSCYVRQTAFGIIFSTAISSVLAKTITVVLAFMAIKPGTKIKKWVGNQSAYSVYLIANTSIILVHTIKCTQLDPLPILHEWHKPNVVLIGQIASHIHQMVPPIPFKRHPSQESYDLPTVMTKFYQHILALAFAVNEINEDPRILPNVTLGFHIYDSYSSARLTYRVTLDLLFKSWAFTPNYKCGIQNNLIGVIGGFDFEISSYMADILGLYKIPQVSYGSFEARINNKMDAPFFYRMVPNEDLQNWGIVQLLLHFGWKWVGLITKDTKGGEHFLSALESMFSKNGICSASRVILPKNIDLHGMISGFFNNIEVFVNRKENAVIIYGETGSFAWLIIFLMANVMIPLADMSYTVKVWILTAQIDVALHILQKEFNMQTLHGAISFSLQSKNVEGFHEYLQTIHLSGEKSNGFIKQFWEHAFDCSISSSEVLTGLLEPCTGEEKLESLPTPFFEMSMTGHSYSIYNAVYALAHSFHMMYSSRLNARASTLVPHVESWKVPPSSLCNDKCGLGYSKKKKEGKKFCCYDCTPCPKGKIANQTVTALVLAVFIKQRHTPVVKANNRMLSYILLTSLYPGLMTVKARTTVMVFAKMEETDTEKPGPSYSVPVPAEAAADNDGQEPGTSAAEVPASLVTEEKGEADLLVPSFIE